MAFTARGLFYALVFAAVALTAVNATSVPPHCRTPRAPRHGRFRRREDRYDDDDYYRPGHVIYYSCDDGYELKGYSWNVCYYNDGHYSADWRYSAPICKAIDCGDLDAPDYGSVDFSSTTFKSKATYSCNDGFVLVGDETRVCQANGKWSGDAPVCKPVDCGKLKDPDYGEVSFTSTKFGSKATYSCDDGFTLVGDKKRVCQANGEWSGEAPVCEPVDCGDLDDPDYGDVWFESTTFRSKATYSCDDGFTLVGDKKRVCQANGEWSGEAPVCKPVDCGDLDDPDYGDVWFRSTTFGSKATYRCDDGFTLVGVKVRICQANGKWSDEAPVCKPVDCGDLDDPDYGDVWFRSTTFRSKATYRCNDGFTLVGVKVRVCQADGDWSDEAPVCKPIDCGDLDDPDYGDVWFRSTKFGSKATYRCDDGFTLVGVKVRVCQANGNWSDEAPVCKPIDCGDLDDPDYGDVWFRSTKFRSKATYRCDDGFTLVGVKVRVCQANGNWSDEAPVCKPIDCGDLDDPDYGDVWFRSTTFRSKATYRCNDGFTLVGVKVRVCQADGDWSDEAPVCKPIDCGDLDDPDYGDVWFRSTKFRSKATYRCDDGFTLVGVKVRVCQANGNWSDEAPVCKPVDCGDLDDPDYGDVWFKSTTFRSKANYRCNDGFTLVGVKVRVCQANGEWSDEAPVCKPVDCGDLDDPDYGDVWFKSTTFRSKANYRCNDGFTLVGVKVRVCQANGKWSDEAPVCKPVDCGDLDDPDYGDVWFKSTTFRSKANYRCNDGFTLVGVKVRVCQANGNWSDEAPVCKPVDCGDLDDPDYGDVWFKSTTFRSKATYSCDDGFTLVGDKKRVCEANGNWSGEAPVCEPVDCGDLDDPDYGKVKFNSTTFGSKAVYSCNDGFKLRGDKKRVCQANGKWSGEAPVCKAVDCGDLPDPDYGSVELTGTTVGSKATYSCNKGFWLEGGSTRVCQYNGQWSGEAPTCKRRATHSCPDLSHPSYGWALYPCKDTGCRAYYSCSYGYRLRGSSVRVCEDGSWSGSEPRCEHFRPHHGY